jgi:hypothetical protein
MPGLVPGIHVFCDLSNKDVDCRVKPGNDPVVVAQRKSFLSATGAIASANKLPIQIVI